MDLIMDEKFKMYLRIIRLCHSSTSLDPIRCCLAMSGAHYNQLTLIKYGIVYAFQSFVNEHKTSTSRIHIDLIDRIKNVVKLYQSKHQLTEIVSEQISSDVFQS